MKSICFVVCQYGKEVNGGAEIHCKMLAERLRAYYHVDVLTTKIVNYNTFEEYYTVDQEIINEINILRFPCTPFDSQLHNSWRKKSKWPRKIRRTLFRFKILKTIADYIPVWKFGVHREREMLKTHGFYSEQFLNYLKEHKERYKAIIFMSYPYPHSIFGTSVAPEKSVLIPTVHEEGDIFRSIQTHMFTTVKHIAFNTEEEKALAQKIFGKKMSSNSIVAVGVETETNNSEISEQQLLARFDLPPNYMHYFGRICGSKMGNLIAWFIDYKQKYKSDLKLVLTGRLFQEEVHHPDIIYTGFVTEEEKIALIKQARLVVNPSRNESLSLLLLEAMNLGKTVLVNGKSDVMKAHCIKSDFAADYYVSKKDFQQKIHRYATDDNTILANNQKAQAYVNRHYNWDTIMNKLKTIIDTI